MKKLIVICSPSDSHLGLFDDLKNYSKVRLYEIQIRRWPFIGDLIGKIVLGHRVNSIVKIPKKYWWTNYKIKDFEGFLRCMLSNKCHVIRVTTAYCDETDS